ncbi:MAG: protein TolR [Rhodospirillaceae bacterium]|nr:protein TolR [Rhodospirillaceae bacterium]OUT78271.1 MAG: protein TolR [Rhodospirillaceae bacterium TMED23]|tara:strand:- start:1620 stop:2114 length:495 start_codon:yes stop_codon:yes gene_type:complete
MSMATNTKVGKNQKARRTGNRLISEINVTPMVDVMLVLLVVFMVTAPLLTVGVEVDLPKTKAGVIREQVEPLAITVKSNNSIFLQNKKIALIALVPRLRAISGANPNVRIFVRGDKSVLYGQIMKVMGTLNAAGFSKVALITEMPKLNNKKFSANKNKNSRKNK